MKKSISDVKLSKIFSIPISTYGMYLAHFGLAVFILGVAISDSKKVYYEGVMKEKEIVKVEKFKIQLKKILEKKEKNWISQIGNFSVEGFKKNISMFAERRLYLDTGMPSTEAAIYRNFFSHLYIVMGQEQPLNSGQRIVRIYFNPFIILIWSGAFLMAFGGLISGQIKEKLCWLLLFFNSSQTSDIFFPAQSPKFCSTKPCSTKISLNFTNFDNAFAV